MPHRDLGRAACMLLTLAACGRSDLLVPIDGGSTSSGPGSGSGSSDTTGSSSAPDTTDEPPLPSTTTDDPPILDTDTTTTIDPTTTTTTEPDPETDTDTDTGPPPAVCGDGRLEPGEECDDGDLDDADACHDDCTVARAVFVALGGNHTCVLVDDGAVRCWGNGNNGRTGHGSIDNIGDDEPASAAPELQLGGPVQQIATGIGHTCVRRNGDLRCFGRAAEGQLGYGDLFDIGDDELPSSVGLVPLGGPVQAVFTRGGSFHGCALMGDGAVRCWGAAGAGRLGLPGVTTPIGDDEPAAAAPTVDVGGPVAALTTGAEHTCARLLDGSVRCWGSNASGQLGLGQPGTVGDDETPASVGPVPVGGVTQSLVAGWFHTCALLDGGSVRCWGRGNNGRLGYGNTTWIGIDETPASVGDVDVGGTVVQLAAGNAHTCALLVGGSVRCWGWGAQGQLGHGNTLDVGDDETPASIGDVPVGAPVVQIAADGNYTCALLDGGQVRCWGNGGDGRLGYGNVDTIGDDETPADIGDVPLFPL